MKAAFTFKTDIVVIGAGQAGLSAAYHLQKRGIKAGKGFIVLDDGSGPGGAWRHRWDSLKLSNVNGINDLPGMHFVDATNPVNLDRPANEIVPEYYERFEKHYQLPVLRPIKVNKVQDITGGFLITTNGDSFKSRGLINATGTWQNPQCPQYPGWEKFKGRQLHTGEYKNAEEFKGKHVIIIGGGISALQLLDEVSQVTTTTWVTRKSPDFRPYPFTPDKGREAVAIVEQKVRKGLPPESVVSVTGIPVTPQIEAMKKRGVLERKPMFDEIIEEGVRWKDGSMVRADILFWNTGFRPSLDHLAPLHLKNEKGGIEMDGKLATRVKKDPRIHLPGYGPSASTIGANRAGNAVAKELIEHLGLRV